MGIAAKLKKYVLPVFFFAVAIYTFVTLIQAAIEVSRKTLKLSITPPTARCIPFFDKVREFQENNSDSTVVAYDFLAGEAIARICSNLPYATVQAAIGTAAYYTPFAQQGCAMDYLIPSFTDRNRPTPRTFSNINTTQVFLGIAPYDGSGSGATTTFKYHYSPTGPGSWGCAKVNDIPSTSGNCASILNQAPAGGYGGVPAAAPKDRFGWGWNWDVQVQNTSTCQETRMEWVGSSIESYTPPGSSTVLADGSGCYGTSMSITHDKDKNLEAFLWFVVCVPIFVFLAQCYMLYAFDPEPPFDDDWYVSFAMRGIPGPLYNVYWVFCSGRGKFPMGKLNLFAWLACALQDIVEGIAAPAVAIAGCQVGRFPVPLVLIIVKCIKFIIDAVSYALDDGTYDDEEDEDDSPKEEPQTVNVADAPRPTNAV